MSIIPDPVVVSKKGKLRVSFSFVKEVISVSVSSYVSFWFISSVVQRLLVNVCNSYTVSYSVNKKSLFIASG